jgi:hypothetical protein
MRIIGQVYGIEVYETHVYIKSLPKYFPKRLWFWLASIFTETTETKLN